MLNKLAKNQYVKITNDPRSETDVEYGVVLDEHDGHYDIMSIGYKNKDGKFLGYPANVNHLVQNYTTDDAEFEEVKENSVRRKMNMWLEDNYKR